MKPLLHAFWAVFTLLGFAAISAVTLGIVAHILWLFLLQGWHTI